MHNMQNVHSPLCWCIWRRGRWAWESVRGLRAGGPGLSSPAGPGRLVANGSLTRNTLSVIMTQARRTGTDRHWHGNHLSPSLVPWLAVTVTRRRTVPRLAWAILVVVTPSGTLRYMISYMISEDNDIDYDIIGFEMSMISWIYDIIWLWYHSFISMISVTYDIICVWYHS